MAGKWNYWGVCIAAILIVLMASTPVSAAGSGKMAVPGVALGQHYGGSEFDRFIHINTTRDGGYIVIGGTASTDHDLAGMVQHGSRDVFVMKFTSSGVLEWKRCYGGSADDKEYWIEQTTEGGYIFVGKTFSNDGQVGSSEYHGGGDVWVVKLDQYGTIWWQHCLGGTGSDEGFSIQQTQDQGYILVGTTASNDGDVKGNHGTGSNDVWIVKLSATGTLQWQRCYGGSGNDNGCWIEQTTDGGYILSAETPSSDGDVVGIHGNYDIWVVKLSEDGMIRWQKCLGGSAYDDHPSIQQTTDGGYIILGTSYSTDGDVIGNHGYSDLWVVKLSDVGIIQWQKCLGGSDGDMTRPYGTSIQQTTDGGYILLGNVYSNDGDVFGNHFPLAYSEAWVVKLDASGGPLWQKCLGGTKDEYGLSIVQTLDNGFILVGYSDSTDGDVGGNYGSIDAWIVKLFGPPTLTSIAPTRNSGTATIISMVFSGANFQPGATVMFYKNDNPNIYSGPVSVSADGTTITANVDITGLKPGVYNIIITNPDGQCTILPNAFTRVCGPAPTVTSISTTSALQGQLLSSVLIKGTNFYVTGGLTAKLNRTGQPDIPGQNYTYTSATQFRCDFQIPAGAATGKWNLVVTNPDGQSGMKKDAFTVNLRTFKPPRVSSITPKTVTAGSTVFINGIAGSFFNASATVAMTGPRGVSIPVSNVTVLSDTKITCDANLTSITKGYATVTVTNPDGKKSTRARAFAIK